MKDLRDLERYLVHMGCTQPTWGESSGPYRTPGNCFWTTPDTNRTFYLHVYKGWFLVGGTSGTLTKVQALAAIQTHLRGRQQHG